MTDETLDEMQERTQYVLDRLYEMINVMTPITTATLLDLAHETKWTLGKIQDEQKNRLSVYSVKKFTNSETGREL